MKNAYLTTAYVQSLRLLPYSFFIGVLYYGVLLWQDSQLLLPKIYQNKLGEAALATTQENEQFLSKSNDVLGGFDTLFSYSKLKKITLILKRPHLNSQMQKIIKHE